MPLPYLCLFVCTPPMISHWIFPSPSDAHSLKPPPPATVGSLVSSVCVWERECVCMCGELAVKAGGESERLYWSCLVPVSQSFCCCCHCSVMGGTHRTKDSQENVYMNRHVYFALWYRITTQPSVLTFLNTKNDLSVPTTRYLPSRRKSSERPQETLKGRERRLFEITV